MQFRDDGGTPAWRAMHTIPARRRRPTFGQWLILIVFFAYVLPFLLIFGAPVIGALWTAIMPSAHAETG